MRRHFAVAVFATSCFARTAAPQPRLASFNLVALDAHGQPVTDLRPEDLKIEDNGKPQPVSFLRFTGGDQKAPSSTGSAGEYSNALSPVLNTTIILFDLLNENLGGRGSGAQELIKALEHAPSPERIALILLTRDSKLFPVHDFDEPTLLSGAGGAPWTSQIRPLLEKAMNEVINHRPPGDRNAMARSIDSYAILSQLAPRLNSIPGRKTLVWITDGGEVSLPLSGDIVWQRQRVAAMMSAAGVVVYTVRQSAAGAAQGVGGHLGLEEIAELTGGHDYPSDYIAQALGDSSREAQSTWRVGFFPPASIWNGKFHKLQVTSSRPDLRIRAPHEFAALKNEINTANDLALLPAVGTVPFDVRDIELHARVSRGAEQGSLHVQITVDPKDLPFEQAGDQFQAQLTVAFLKYADVARASQPKSITTPLAVNLDLTREQLDRADHQGVVFAQDVTLDSSVHALRLVVYNRASNQYGTLTVPVTPP